MSDRRARKIAARPDKRIEALLRREIAWRDRQRRKPAFSMAALRCAEISRFLVYRYGPILPDDDAGRGDARLMAHHLAKLSDPERRIVNWLNARAPWLIGTERAELLAEIDTKPRRWRADKLANRLGLTDAERRHLRIRSVGAIDVLKSERTTRRKQTKREASTAARRAKGAEPRKEWLAQRLTRTKPWEALGISRRTWFRRQAKPSGTGPYPI